MKVVIVWFGCVLLGMAVGIAAWVLMIIVTSGVCSVPVLHMLWCSLPLGGGAPQHVTPWDWVLLVFFIGAGFAAGLEEGEKVAKRMSR